MAEPGTYFVRSAFVLNCSIIGVKEIESVNSMHGVKYKYYIDDGLYNSFNKVIYVEDVTPIPLKVRPNNK